MVSDFEYKGTKISYSDQGKGTALVFIHGFLEEKSMWNSLIENFLPRYRCISIDLFGHGNSENYGYIHSMTDQAEMIYTLLTSLKLRRYIVIGHSMGGYIALELGKSHSKNIKGLVLQNSTAYPDSDEKIANRNRAILAVKENQNLFIQIAVPMLFSEKNRTAFHQEVKEVTSKALKTSKQGIIAALEGMKIRKNNAHLLKENNFPILMIIGREDPALNFESLIEQVADTKVETVVFNDGHMSHIENYNELNLVYSDFFKKCN